MLRRLALVCAALLSAVPALGADVSSGYVQGPGGYYNPADRSGPYTIDPTGKAQILGSVAPQASSSAAGGLSVYRVSNPAGAAGMMVKAAPGRIYSFNLCNAQSSARYVRFYDSTAPVPGTTAVYAGAIVISAGTCQQFTTNFGLAFPTGIGLGITAANGDGDTTPVTAGDVTGFIGFQ